MNKNSYLFRIRNNEENVNTDLLITSTTELYSFVVYSVMPMVSHGRRDQIA
jgi:hypothetical protein